MNSIISERKRTRNPLNTKCLQLLVLLQERNLRPGNELSLVIGRQLDTKSKVYHLWKVITKPPKAFLT